jgi:hypothetical protein
LQMSISIVALSLPIRSPDRRHRRTLPPPLNAPPSATRYGARVGGAKTLKLFHF